MSRIAAVVLAAGVSARMGQQKVLLPWREGETIIEQVVTALQSAQIDPIYVVAGGSTPQISRKVTPLGAQVVHNPDYAVGEMLSSFKIGLSALADDVDAVLIALGDQPRIDAAIVRQVVDAYQSGEGSIVAPRFHSQRGHPILIDRRFWTELSDLPPDGAPRDVVKRHPEASAWIDVDDDSVVSDVDTPEQYAAERAKAGLPPVAM